MRFFRIYIYLGFFVFVKSLITLVINSKKRNIENTFNKITNKKFSFLTSQLRVGFILVLQYLIRKHPDKNEIILSPLTLPAVVNSIIYAGGKPIFVDLCLETGLPNIDNVKHLINKKTAGILITHLYSNEIHLNND